MIVQLVAVSIKPAQRNAWLEFMAAQAARTRAEEGCVGFEFAEDLMAPNRFILIERWRDLEAQYGHLRASEFAEMMEAISEMLAAPPEASINEVAASHSLEEALRAAGAPGAA